MALSIPAIRLPRLALVALVVLFSALLSACGTPAENRADLEANPNRAARAGKAQEIVENALTTLNAVERAENLEPISPFLREARAVIIFPKIVRGGFFIGGHGGSGVLLVKQNDGTWSYPSFIGVGGLDVGIIVGAQVSSVVITVMNDGALDSVLRRRARFGADVSVAAASFGVGAGIATTTNFKKDLYVFSRNAGLFAGAAIGGAALLPQGALNQAFYDEVEARDSEAIVLRGEYANPSADPLRSRLGELIGLAP